jgi:hypothetical protein
MFLVFRFREALGSRAILDNRICNVDRCEMKSSKPSLIRINAGWEVTRIKEATDSPKRPKKL